MHVYFLMVSYRKGLTTPAQAHYKPKRLRLFLIKNQLKSTEKIMSLPLMPKATAVWLVENTTISFDQIATFCGMHPLEVQGIADGDVASGIIGQDPIARGLLSLADIERAQANPKQPLKLTSEFSTYIKAQKKVKNRYTPVARRSDKPDAVAWLIKHHPEVTDAQISKLIGTTKSTIAAIRGKDHWNMGNIRPRDPVLLGLCTQTDLFAIVDKIEKQKELDARRAEREAAEKAAKRKAKKAAKAAGDAEATE
jgi:uncharacterized protein